ncbi:hypothetical protein COLO4_11640 [Corchorus olitorius]|uniref:E3 ubiquitin-protein ligase FANCL n=1 Tax=Corchorus olitorius TaxID=93759 RepID=A0A1R3K3Q6_9ROSI|nr:hypothetical protein COLO4_11640 [Corchorus olitorius]
MEVNEQARCRELAKSSSFYRVVYSEIEEVGWEHLVRLGGDLTFLSFRVLDKKGRVHILEIQLNKAYPKVPPMVSADVPYIFNFKWSMNSRLKILVQQFQEHLEKLQEFWSTLDEIDRSLWVVGTVQASRAMSSRQIHIGNDCLIMLSIDINGPRSLPECRFMGTGTTMDSLRKAWKRNSNRWMRDKPFSENLEYLLKTQLPRPPDAEKNNNLVECGICYAQYLPIGDDIGPEGGSGSGTDYTCENSSCSHSMFCSAIVRTVQSQLQSNSMPQRIRDRMSPYPRSEADSSSLENLALRRKGL